MTRSGTTLEGRAVAITGRLASMTRENAVAAIERLGGRYQMRVDKDTTTLVLGMDGWPLRKDGRLTHALVAARKLQESGFTFDHATLEPALRFLLGRSGEPAA